MVNLAPRLDQWRKFDWPTEEGLCQKLIAIIESIPEVYIQCERDTDQEPLNRLSDKGDVVKALKDAIRYSLSQEVACPTFCYGKADLD